MRDDMGRFERIGLAIDGKISGIRFRARQKITRFRYWLKGERPPTPQELFGEVFRKKQRQLRQNVADGRRLVRRMEERI